VLLLSDEIRETFLNDTVSKFIDLANAENIFIAIRCKPANGLEFSGMSLTIPNHEESAELAGPKIDGITQTLQVLDQFMEWSLLM
jgi:bifunctional ADP-heptose synthase (sugar kinase/adenylyltransferase)